MLEVWHRRGWITTAGFNAAEKLRDAFEATQRAPGWPDNDRVQSSPKPDHAVTIQIDRLSKYHVIARLILAADMQIIAACVLDRHGPERVRDKRGHRIYAGKTCAQAISTCATRWTGWQRQWGDRQNLLTHGNKYLKSP